ALFFRLLRRFISRHEVFGLIRLAAPLRVSIPVCDSACDEPRPPVFHLGTPRLQREERHPLCELPRRHALQELPNCHAKGQRQPEDKPPGWVGPQFPASSSTSSGRRPESRCETSKIRFSATADLRPSSSASSSLNNRLPSSSTTQRATSFARMFRRFTRVSLPRASTMDCSNWSRSAAVRPRTMTSPPHSGTDTVSVGRSLTCKIASRLNRAMFSP